MHVQPLDSPFPQRFFIASAKTCEAALAGGDGEIKDPRIAEPRPLRSVACADSPAKEGHRVQFCQFIPRAPVNHPGLGVLVSVSPAKFIGTLLNIVMKGPVRVPERHPVPRHCRLGNFDTCEAHARQLHFSETALPPNHIRHRQESHVLSRDREVPELGGGSPGIVPSPRTCLHQEISELGRSNPSLGYFLLYNFPAYVLCKTLAATVLGFPPCLQDCCMLDITIMTCSVKNPCSTNRATCTG